MRRLLPFPLKYPGVRLVFPDFLLSLVAFANATWQEIRGFGGRDRLTGVTYSRSQYWVRPSMETPMNPRTFSLVPPSSTEIKHL